MWESVLMGMAAVVLAGSLLSLGYYLGTMSSKSVLAAANAVSEMTKVLAKEANRQADFAATLSEAMELVKEQTGALRQMAERLQTKSENLTILTEAFIQRGFLRAARTPPQTGQRGLPGPPPPVQSALTHSSPSPTEPIATG